MRRRVVGAVVTAILVTALFGGAAQARPDRPVPLRGSFTGVGESFSGNFSHLGRFDGVVVDGAATWTAANGDTVTNVTTSFVLVDAVGPGVFTYLQTIEITGGTGRFDGATGSAEVTGTIDLSGPVPSYDGRLEGTISSPGPRVRT